MEGDRRDEGPAGGFGFRARERVLNWLSRLNLELPDVITFLGVRPLFWPADRPFDGPLFRFVIFMGGNLSSWGCKLFTIISLYIVVSVKSRDLDYYSNTVSLICV